MCQLALPESPEEAAMPKQLLVNIFSRAAISFGNHIELPQ